MSNIQWLTWAKKLQSIAQIGLTYTRDRFDHELYVQIRKISLEIMDRHTEVGLETLQEIFGNETGYQTPKLDVRVAVVRDHKILLVREKDDQSWALPGGWIDIDTSVMEAARKEAREEAGADVRPEKLIALLDRRKQDLGPSPYSITTAFVGCSYVGGVFRENNETDDARFFHVSDLPTLSGLRTSRGQIEMCYRSMMESWPGTVFD